MFSRAAIGGVIAAGLALGLSGCTNDPDPVYRQALHVDCTHVGGPLGDLACTAHPDSSNPQAVSRYCYATIGTTNCFDRPDPDRKNQALGSSGY
jgi:hypothetical protein